MTYSRQEIVKALHRAGMDDIAAAALTALPEHVDDEAAAKFCVAHHLTLGFVTDLMGGSP
jgi:hypothetical protein